LLSSTTRTRFIISWSFFGIVIVKEFSDKIFWICLTLSGEYVIFFFESYCEFKKFPLLLYHVLLYRGSDDSGIKGKAIYDESNLMDEIFYS